MLHHCDRTSGFIGGAVAARLLADGYEGRGRARDEAKAQPLADKEIVPVLGRLDDTDLSIREVCSFEGAVDAADSDHLGAATALLDGLSGSGNPLLQTGGTGLYAENTRGEASDRTYDDEVPLPSQPALGDRASIDRQILPGARRGVQSVIRCNSGVCG